LRVYLFLSPQETIIFTYFTSHWTLTIVIAYDAKPMLKKKMWFSSTDIQFYYPDYNVIQEAERVLCDNDIMTSMFSFEYKIINIK